MLSALQTAFKILAGFVLVKVVALAAGPEGVAQLGQFQNLVTVIAILSGGMFFTGVTKLVAERTQDNGQAINVVVAALKVSMVSFGCVAIATIAGHDYISARVLKDPSLSGFVLILPGLVFLTVLYGLWLAVLNGFRLVRELVIASIACSLTMIVLTFAFALPYGEVGAYVSILVPPAIVVVVMFISRCNTWEWPACRAGTTLAPPYRELAKFALMGLVSAVAAPLAQMVLREYLVDNLSLDQAGIWQGVTRISEVYLGFITSSLSIYFLPKLAQIKNNNELALLVVRVLKLTVPAAIFLGLAVYIFRDFLIRLLFTSSFVSMRGLFKWQLVGDFIKIISWIFAYIIYVRGSAFLFIVGEVVFNITYVIIGMTMVSWYGVDGSVFAYGINYAIYFLYVVVVALMTTRYEKK